MKPKLSFLDLRRCGLSIIERLALEEALLRHDPLQRMWAIVGTHDPVYSRHIDLSSVTVHDNDKRKDDTSKTSVSSISGKVPFKYENCAIVLGIGGKPKDLVHLEKSNEDGVLLIKRFSGGGTVVVDHSSLFTTFIGRTEGLPHVKPYPQDIMIWSANEIFDPVFRLMNDDLMEASNIGASKTNNLVMQGRSCGFTDLISDMRATALAGGCTRNNNIASIPPPFSLRENDYVLGEKKMGGNAQSIIKGGWLHHTSFLWDYFDEHMEYLTLPNKRPDYRGDRDHNDFLVKLKDYYSPLGFRGKDVFFDKVKEATHDVFDVQNVTFEEVISLVKDELGGVQTWFEGNCRTKIIVDKG